MNINDKEDLDPITNDKGDKVVVEKHTIGGYSQKYQGGYGSDKETVQEIRNASNNMGEELQKIAKEIKLPKTQKKGYFNFGAGYQVIGEDYVFNAPSAFVIKKEYMGRELVIYSLDCEEEYRKSPVIIEIARVKLEKKITQQEHKKRQKAGAKITKRKYEEITVNDLIATLTTEKREYMPIERRLSILKKSGKEVININITIQKDIENYDEITKRIYFSFYITEYGVYKEKK